MKKIVVCTITLQPEETFASVYLANQKDIYKDSKYSEYIYYPINAVLANELKKDDDVKVVLIKAADPDDPDYEKKFEANSAKFINEFKAICEEKGVVSNIDAPQIIETEFTETKDVFEERFMQFFNIFEQDCEVYADMTYGSRVITMIMMNVLNFAEKFFNADLKSIVYGKVSYIRDAENPKRRIIKKPGTVCDLSSLYYLGNLTNIIKADSGESAIRAFKKFLCIE